ncbi:MAG: hypothetical protein ACR2K0_04735 [Acidimicrobiales bacterium]
MGGTPQPRLGEVFSGWDGLGVAARRSLAGLLMVPGRPPPLLAGELAAVALPRRADELHSLGAVVEDGLGPEALVPLAGWRFDEVVPAIRGREADIASARWPARLRNLLERNQVSTWAELGELTMADIQSWTDAGPVTLVKLVRRAIDAGVAHLVETSPGWSEEPAGADDVALVPGHERTTGTAADVALLLGHERTIGTDQLHRSLAQFTGDSHPEAVRAAATRLLAPPVERPGTCLEALTRVLVAAGDERDRLVFERLTLAPHGPVTGAEVRAALEISVERVRQIRMRAEDRARSFASDLPGPLHQEVEALAGRLGAAAPLAAVDESLASSGLPALPDSRSLLALWLAGPYRGVGGHPGWIATDPAELRAETRRMLGEDGGVRLADQVAKELDVLGLAPELVEHWLAEQPVRRVADVLVDTSGPPADVAERVLSALGRSMTVEELAGWAGGGPHDAGASALWPVLSRDHRFVRVSADAFELTEWGSARYDELPSLFGPSAPAEALDGPACSWLPVEVDGALLAGRNGSVPESLVSRLGMRVGGQRTFASRYGPVTLSYDSGGPTRSPLRHVALASGAAIGDKILIGFPSGPGDALVERVPGEPAVTPTT